MYMISDFFRLFPPFLLIEFFLSFVASVAGYSAQIDSFLADYKQTGAQTVPLKAIITPQNIFWTVEALFKELWKEHLHFLPE